MYIVFNPVATVAPGGGDGHVTEGEEWGRVPGERMLYLDGPVGVVLDDIFAMDDDVTTSIHEDVRESGMEETGYLVHNITLADSSKVQDEVAWFTSGQCLWIEGESRQSGSPKDVLLIGDTRVASFFEGRENTGIKDAFGFLMESENSLEKVKKFRGDLYFCTLVEGEEIIVASEATITSFEVAHHGDGRIEAVTRELVRSGWIDDFTEDISFHDFPR